MFWLRSTRPIALAGLVGLSALVVACSGSTLESGGSASSTTAAATPSTTGGKAPASTATSSPAPTTSTSTPGTSAKPATTSTTKPSTTTAPSGGWPKVGDSDLQPPAGYTDLGGGTVSDAKHLAYSVFKTPTGGYVATIDQTTLDSKGRVATRVVKAVLALPAPAAGETLANGCTNAGGGSFYVAYAGKPPAGQTTYHPTKAWLVNADALRFDPADVSTVECHSAGD